jgi:hypothetical protein
MLQRFVGKPFFLYRPAGIGRNLSKSIFGQRGDHAAGRMTPLRLH